MHSPDLGINSFERVLGNGVRAHVNSKGKSDTGGSDIFTKISPKMVNPTDTAGRSDEEEEEGGTHDATSRRKASPTHCRLSYSGPLICNV